MNKAVGSEFYHHVTVEYDIVRLNCPIIHIRSDYWG